eukprot:gene29966-18032_t
MAPRASCCRILLGPADSSDASDITTPLLGFDQSLSQLPNMANARFGGVDGAIYHDLCTRRSQKEAATSARAFHTSMEQSYLEAAAASTAFENSMQPLRLQAQASTTAFENSMRPLYLHAQQQGRQYSVAWESQRLRVNQEAHQRLLQLEEEAHARANNGAHGEYTLL